MMRNNRQIEIKRGYYAWTVDGAEGRIVSTERDAQGRCYVKLDSGNTVHADSIVEVLPPMRVLEGGVVKANPLVRVKVKSPSQRGGDPSPRLVKRRKATQKAPKGFYANPVQTDPIVVQYKKTKGENWTEYARFPADKHNKEIACLVAAGLSKNKPLWIIQVFDESK